MTHAILARKKTTPAGKKKAAAKKAAPNRPGAAPAIDRLLERVRARGEALSADIKDLLVRIG